MAQVEVLVGVYGTTEGELQEVPRGEVRPDAVLPA